jgi:ankyrin repeat protein
MKLISSLVNISFLPGFLYSLILITSYFQLYVLVVIGASALLNYIILKAIYFDKKETETIIKTLYHSEKEYGTKELNKVFWMTVYTAWVSPCTVWANNFALKTKFLFVSSSVTIAVNFLSITLLYIFVHFNGLIDEVNPPFSHCFINTEFFNSSNYQFHFSENLSVITLNICEQNDECFPTIRICSDNENPTDYLDLVCFKIGYSLFILSFCSSICLQILGSYNVMNKYCGFVSCPEMFYNFFKEIAENYRNLNVEKQKEFFNFVKASIEKSQESAKMVKLFLKNSRNKQNHKVWNNLINTSHDFEDKIPKDIWSPMHKAVEEKKYGLWCLYNIIGGLEVALNGHALSTIQILSNGKDDKEKWLSSNEFVKWWITKSLRKYGYQPLHKAAQLGDTILTEIIIENGYDMEEKNYLGQTALHIAATNAHLECLKYLIDKGADLEAKDNAGRTPLHSAAEGGHFECLKYLIDSGTDLETKNSEGKTPLLIVSKEGYFECLKYLIDKGADLEANDNDERTSLLISVQKYFMYKYWIDKQAHLETEDFERQTTIHTSCKRHFECLKYLINKGANIEAPGMFLRTPLHLSAEEGHLECLKYLIDNGADLEANDYDKRTPLLLSAAQGHLECLIYLSHKGADLKAKDNKAITPLHLSAEEGHFECLKYLIDKGADLEAKDNDGRTPLHLSAYQMFHSKTFQCLTFLIDQKAEVYARDNQNNTPLHILGQYIRVSINIKQHLQFCLRAAEELIRAGAHLTAVNKEGKTPMANKFVQKLREQKPELFLEKSV